MHTVVRQKKRICVYCQTWESGGIEAFLSNLLQHMRLEQIEIDIVVEELRESIYTNGLKAHGIRFIVLSGSQHRWITNYRLFAMLLKERHYAAIHLNIFQARPLIYLHLALRQKVPVRIAHSHNTMLRKSLFRPLKIVIHTISKVLFANCATDLWACSSAAASFMFSKQTLKKRGFQFVPNGIDFDRFHLCKEKREQVRRELHIEGAYVIGNIGRLCYQKNQSFLIDVFLMISQCEPNSILLLVGKGTDQKRLVEKARKLGIMDRIIFYGASEKVEELLWAMDIFAFPSRFEGFGIVSIEAQAAGLPVIVSENVPPEAQVCDGVYTVPLSEGTQRWAEELLLHRNERSVISVQKMKQFDISGIAEEVEDRYLK